MALKIATFWIFGEFKSLQNQIYQSDLDETWHFIRQWQCEQIDKILMIK